MDREDQALLYAGASLLALVVCGPTVAFVRDDTPKYSPAYIAGLTAQAENPISTFTPEAPGFPQSGDVSGTYTTVGRGETLSEIAARLGVSQVDLAHANGITNLDLVYAGSTLRIPGGSSGPRFPQAGRATTRIEIRPGDTLYGLAAEHNTTIDAIKAANGLASDVIFAGNSLTLP